MNITPMRFQDRYSGIDALRGLALLFIVLLNMRDFAFPAVRPWLLGVSGPVEAAMLALLEAFVRPIGYPLFACLLGFGVALTFRRLESAAVLIMRRRLFGLAVIGLLHGVLIWRGDILFLYATLGGVLLWFRQASVIWWWCVAVGCLLVQQWIWPVAYSAPVSPSIWSAYASGSYFEVFPVRALEYLQTYIGGVFVALHIVGFFLLGGFLALSRAVEEPAPLLFGWCFLLVGAVAAAASFPVLASAGLVIGLFSLLSSCNCRWLVAAGRMSLSLYLIQSLVFTFYFYGYGFGFFGKLSLSLLLGLGFAFWGFQVWWADWLLRRFSMGPVEWVLRSWVYRRGGGGSAAGAA